MGGVGGLGLGLQCLLLGSVAYVHDACPAVDLAHGWRCCQQLCWPGLLPAACHVPLRCASCCDLHHHSTTAGLHHHSTTAGPHDLLQQTLTCAQHHCSLPLHAHS